MVVVVVQMGEIGQIQQLRFDISLCMGGKMGSNEREPSFGQRS